MRGRWWSASLFLVACADGEALAPEAAGARPDLSTAPLRCDPLPDGPLPAAPAARDPQAAPNLLVFLADDVGTPWVSGFTGADDPVPTPAIDALAAQGVRFVAAWGAPTCTPSRAALFTGLLPHRTGVGTSVNPTREGERGLAAGTATLASLLQAAPEPYHTGMVGKWHLTGPGDGGFAAPAALGFDAFRGTMGNLLPSHAFDGQPQNYADWERLDDDGLARTGCFAVRQVTLDAMALLETLPEPWLLVVSYHAAHVPWDGIPAALAVDGARPADPAGRYRALIALMDAEIGRIEGALHPDVAARTWTVWMSDNGAPDEVAEADRSKHSLYEGGVRVPLLIAGPGVVDPGRAEPTPVAGYDLLPTLLGLAGAASPAGLDGVDLSPLLTRRGGWEREIVVVEQFEPNGVGVPRTHVALAARDGRYKLIRADEERDELYDLVADPDESVNLARDAGSRDALLRLRAALPANP